MTLALQTVTGGLPAAGQEDPALGDLSIRFVAVAGGVGSPTGGAGLPVAVCGARAWCAGCREQAVLQAVVPRATVSAAPSRRRWYVLSPVAEPVPRSRIHLVGGGR